MRRGLLPPDAATAGMAGRIAAIAGWVALAAALAARLGATALDDFFITYRYADNLARGRGFCFNPGERVFGTTAPGFGLLLAAAHRLTSISIPWLGTLSTGVALVAVAALLLRDAARCGRAAEAVLGGTLAVGCTWVWGCRGAEVPVALALLLGAAAVAVRWPVAAGLLAGAAIWMRPDAALGAGLLAALLAREPGGRWRLPWRYLAALALTAAAGLLAAWLAFGSLVPNTWRAKRLGAVWQPEAGAWSWWWTGGPLFQRHLGDRWELLLALGLLGQILLVRRGGRTGRLLAAYGLAAAAAYPFLGVPFAAWYAIPLVVALLYGLAYLLGGLARRALAPGPPALRAAVAALALALAALTLPSCLAAEGRWLAGVSGPQLHFRGYRDAGLALRAGLRPEDHIAAIEVGTVAYFGDRPVDDLLGLVSPESLPYLARRDLAGAFFARPPEALVLRPRQKGFLGDLLASRRFRRRYREVLRLDPDSADWTAIYRRRPNAPP